MIEDPILSTLAYYDTLDFPLTAKEIKRYLIRIPGSGEDFDSGELDKDGRIGQREGYYFLFGREYLVPLRLERARQWQRKWKRMKRIAKLISLVPFIRVVFASGSLALRNTSELSDLDILLITKHGRIATARFVLTALLGLFGLRRKPKDIVAPDLICPNHYVTDVSMAIPARNMYTAQLYANLVPLIARDIKLLDKFRESNAWVLNYLFQWRMDTDQLVEFSLGRWIARIIEWLLSGRVGDLIERRLFVWQKRRVESHPLVSASKGRVVFSEQEIALHPDSPDERFLDPYKERLAKLGLDFYTKLE